MPRIPKLYSTTAPDLPDNHWARPWEEVAQEMKSNLALLNADDAKAKAAGKLVGRYFYVSVADGRAFYQVIATTKTTATVNWCPRVAPDDWQDSILRGGMKLPLDRVEAYINRMDALAKMFGGEAN